MRGVIRPTESATHHKWLIFGFLASAVPSIAEEETSVTLHSAAHHDHRGTSRKKLRLTRGNTIPDDRANRDASTLASRPSWESRFELHQEWGQASREEYVPRPRPRPAAEPSLHKTRQRTGLPRSRLANPARNHSLARTLAPCRSQVIENNRYYWTSDRGSATFISKTAYYFHKMSLKA